MTEPPRTREEAIDLLNDIAVWREYGHARGILGERFRRLIHYLQQTGEIDEKGERIEERDTTYAQWRLRSRPVRESSRNGTDYRNGRRNDKGPRQGTFGVAGSGSQQ